jgi:hypothetical protein
MKRRNDIPINGDIMKGKCLFTYCRRYNYELLLTMTGTATITSLKKLKVGKAAHWRRWNISARRRGEGFSRVTIPTR